MKRLLLWALFGTLVIILYTSGFATAGDKVTLCHKSLITPDSWNTISVAPALVEWHMSHGDYDGACEDLSGNFCDDNNECTDEVVSHDGESFVCTYTPIDCDDGIACTDDFCDPTFGCVHEGGCESDEACDEVSQLLLKKYLSS